MLRVPENLDVLPLHVGRMEPISPCARTSITRSPRGRRRLLMALASFGRASLAQLAHATGVPPYRVKWMMYGRAPYYAPELALVPLGLASEVGVGRGRVFEITTRGLRKARSVAAARVRLHMRANLDRKLEDGVA